MVEEGGSVLVIEEADYTRDERDERVDGCVVRGVFRAEVRRVSMSKQGKLGDESM